LKVTAEGVETAHQHQLLQELGCDTMQGYYFGAPTILPPWKTPTRALRA
ncbi:EAL domain-containing protein, partial [Candidatus Falkowbacteria bacterium]|nr:EAL domain-containing protein [Candidatus Falkowbacteria bacterium]